MKYTDFYLQLLTESWKTYVPSNNQKILLYDFYVLSYLTTLPIGSEQKGFSGNLIGRDPSEVKLDIEHAQSVLLPKLIKKLKNALFLSICAEIRHLDDVEQEYGEYGKNKLLIQYSRYYHQFVGKLPPVFQPKRDIKALRVTPVSGNYEKSYDAAMLAIQKTGSSEVAFAELAAELFRKMKWRGSYGGIKWANIAEGYLLLHKAQTNNQKQVAIDHAYDLQHNTGTALNKVTDFKIDGSYEWIEKALDHKRDARSMYELLPYCSSDMRKLALEAFKIANVAKPTNVKQHGKNKSEKPKKQKFKPEKQEFNIGDNVIYKGDGYTLVGKIIDKQPASLKEDIVVVPADPEYDYKIIVNETYGNPPSGVTVNSTYNIKANRVKNLVKWPTIKHHTTPSSIKPSEIQTGNTYDVPEYGCTFHVTSIEQSPPPYKAIAHGQIDSVYNAEKFEQLKLLSSKPLHVGVYTAIHTDYLKVKSDNKPSKADASANFKFKFDVGDKIVYSNAKHTLNAIVLERKIIIIKGKEKEKYRALIYKASGIKPEVKTIIGKKISVIDDKSDWKLVQPEKPNDLTKLNGSYGVLYNVPAYGIIVKINSVSGSIASGFLWKVYDLKKYTTYTSTIQKKLAVGNNIKLDAILLTSLEDKRLYDAKDSNGNLLIVGHTYKSFACGVQGILVQIYPLDTKAGVQLQITKITDEVKKVKHLPNANIGDLVNIDDILSSPDFSQMGWHTGPDVSTK